MSTSNPSPGMARQRRRWPYVVGGIFGLLIVLYFVATSGFFIKSVILPRVSASVGSDITVEDISVSPFSSVTIRGLKVVPKGEPALAEVREVRARYSLISILKGDIKVDEVTVDSPVITVIEKPGGTGNLATFLKNLPKSESKPSTDSASTPPQLAVRNVNVKGGTLRYDLTEEHGARTQAEISGLNVSVDQIANGQSTKLGIDAGLAATMTPKPGTPSGQGGKVGGRLGGTVEVALSDKLLPKTAKGGIKLDVAQGTEAFKTFEGLGLVLDTDLAPDDLRDFALRFTQRGQELARIGLKGPMNLASGEIRLAYEIKGLDRRVLDLAGAAAGVDLGDVRVGATGRVDVLKGFATIASSGRVQVDGLSLGTPGGKTPVINLGTDYRVSVNQTDKNALVERFDITGTQGGSEILKGGLDRAMNLSWDKATPGFRESTFSLKLGQIDLAAWRALLPSNAPTALVSTDLKVTAEQAGKMLRFSLNTTLDKLSASVGTAQVKDAGSVIRLNGTLSDFEVLVIENYAVEIRQGREVLLNLGGVADWNLKSQQGGVQTTLAGQLPSLLGLYPLPGIVFTSGDLKANLSASQKATGSLLDASFSLSKLTGRAGDIQLADYQVTASASLGLRGDELDVQRISLAAQTGFNTGGSVMAKANYNLSRKAGSAEFNAVAVNESALGPFLAAALAPNKLISVGLDVQGKVDVNLAGTSDVKTDVRVSNLRVDDPSGRLPKTPLQLGLNLDVGSDLVRTEVRRLMIDLGATPRATNRLELTAKLDLGTNKPTPTTVTVKSAGLDLTPLYDLFAGSGTNAPAETAEAPAPAAPGNVEPAPIRLPLRDATMDIDIARVFLREIDIAGLKGQVRAKDDVVTVDGFGLSLNGAPVRAKALADLTVPGYRYDVDFAAERLPLAPLANSFVQALKSSAQGELSLDAKVKGAGVTGASLSRNLTGSANLLTTNALIKLPETPIQLPRLVTILLPFLPARVNPASLLTLIGKRDVIAEPIRVLEAHATLGGGGMQLTNTRVASSAFAATVGGGLRFADILTNSPLNMPVGLAFASGGQVPATRNIGTVKGTIGKTEFDKDYAGLAGLGLSLTLPGVGNVGDRVGQGLNLINQKSGGAVDKVGGAINAIIPGGAPAGGSSTNTNAPSGNPFGGLIRGITGGGKTTNAAPAASTNAPAPAPKPLNPLDLLRGRK